MDPDRIESMVHPCVWNSDLFPKVRCWCSVIVLSFVVYMVLCKEFYLNLCILCPFVIFHDPSMFNKWSLSRTRLHLSIFIHVVHFFFSGLGHSVHNSRLGIHWDPSHHMGRM